MSSQQICIYLTHSAAQKVCVCENEGTINYYRRGSALKVRNTCRCSLTQRLARWCSPVAPKIWVETQTRVAKGQQMGRAEAIQSWVVYFQRYNCFSVSVREDCLLGWERVMETRAEFHFSCVYTFSAMLSSLRNWANHDRYRLRPSTPVQLCW